MFWFLTPSFIICGVHVYAACWLARDPERRYDLLSGQETCANTFEVSNDGIDLQRQCQAANFRSAIATLMGHPGRQCAMHRTTERKQMKQNQNLPFHKWVCTWKKIFFHFSHFLRVELDIELETFTIPQCTHVCRFVISTFLSRFPLPLVARSFSIGCNGFSPNDSLVEAKPMGR